MVALAVGLTFWLMGPLPVGWASYACCVLLASVLRRIAPPLVPDTLVQLAVLHIF